MRARGALWLMVAAAALPAAAATKSIDLDTQTSNGAESRCDLNVLQTFPVMVENVITNKAVGDAFSFAWRSAGPGGFSSAAAPGTAGGVGARWTWATNQTVYAYTGGSCATDACFLKTAGPDVLPATCTGGCFEDGVALTVARGTAGNDVALSWTGGSAAYGVYRSSRADTITAAANRLGQTSGLQYSDVPPQGGVFFYRVRSATCLSRRPCSSDAACAPSEEGTCVSVGPFAVPGRSLVATDVTVSSSSLTSSLVTFFSPPTELFRITSTASPGSFQETVVNGAPTPLTVVTEASPPGCCPANPDVPHQLRCGAECVDYLNDPSNCGACGNVCGDGTCCVNGNCASLCPDGQIWCDGECRDPLNDNANCGACGNACGEGSCCVEGSCTPFVCEEGDLCGGECVDLQNDNAHCGACGNVCGPGSCCTDGVCVSTCAAGRTFCGGLCYDLQNDPGNCGACGNVCAEDSICTGGLCVPCSGQGGARDACDNRCVNLRTDPYNCGECGHSCNLGCPSGFKGVCSQGQSCSCVPGTPAPQPPSNIPPPTPPFCPNTNPPPGTTDPVCANPSPSGPTAGVCPSPGPPPPDVEEAPVCVIDASSVTVPPGGTVSACRTGGVVFKEVPTVVRVCGDGIPGPDGTCLDGVSKVTTGTFMRFLPLDTEIGPAYLTPFAVRVLAEDSNDGMIQPGETATLRIDVVNAGPTAIAGATASLLAAPVDLTDDGVDDPLALTILQGTSSYGSIAGTEPSTECEPVALHPASNAIGFRVTVPAGHPGATSTPLKLQFAGSVDGEPFTMDVPLALGIADRCVPAAGAGDYDGLEGLLSPMAKLVPVGDPLPSSLPRLNPGSTAPLKMKVTCGGANLGAGQMDPPEIVGLSEAVRGDLEIASLDLNDSANPDDPLFRWNPSGATWIFNMRTDNLGTGIFTLTIRVAGRKDYATRFEVR